MIRLILLLIKPPAEKLAEKLGSALVRGTLRASASFPADAFVLDIGHGVHADGGGGEDIGVQELLIDGGLRAAGGLRVAGVMGGSIGPRASLPRTQRSMRVH